MTNTFIQSRSSLENCARFQAKRGGLHPFLERNGEKPYPIGLHVPLWLIYGRSPPFFHRRKQPLASSSTPIKQWLITGNCCFPCCVDADGNGEAGVSSPGCRLLVGRWTPEHNRRLILPGQCVPPNIVRHSWRIRWVLRDSFINNLDHPQLGTTCSSGWL